ncbi:MAG: hypothetical protein QOH68_195 [Nocardioidaceae bacterium]|jgi:hypothetical protein|nr:hypothetical protein [Nocardioidaceae bacterium]
MSAAVAHDDDRTGPVTRTDLERKLRELQGGVGDTAQSAKSTVLAVGAAVAVGVVALAWWMGRRNGKKRTTVVEVRRV